MKGQETGNISVVVVLTLTRTIQSVVTGLVPVTLEQRNTLDSVLGEKHKQLKVVHA